MTLRRILGSLVSVAFAWVCSSCAPSGFRDETKISGVRILASASDPAYAKPGQNFTVNVLAYDGRPTKPEPMQVYWLPIVCPNPPDDAYYGCFQEFASALASTRAGADGGADGGSEAGAAGGLPTFPTGVAVPLPTGPSYQFQMPLNAVTAHPVAAGTPVPYGLAIVFNIACAGHIELLPRDPTSDNPVQVPLGCFDTNENLLTPDDYVIGFTRVYAFDALTNANPIIDHVDVEGHAVDLAQGFTTGRCQGGACPKVHIGPVVPEASWEENPEVLDANGKPLKEEIWADFYTTFGSLTDSARLLYDSRSGSIGTPDTTDDQWSAPTDPGDGFIFIVVHDSRGGAAWAQVPVHVD